MLHLGGRAYPRKNRVAFLQTVLHYLWIEAGTYQKAGACLYGSISLIGGQNRPRADEHIRAGRTDGGNRGRGGIGTEGDFRTGQPAADQ